MDAVMLSIRHLTKSYPDVVAVDDLSLEIGRGEFFGLLGPNGAGKTTTVRMVSSLTPMTSGEITIDGEPVSRRNFAIRHRLGVVPQRNNLDVELTAWENLELHGRLHGMPRPARRSRADQLLEFAGLTSRRDSIVKHFSGGMKQRLMIARGVMHEPALLLLDEPTVGLDANARRAIWDLLRGLKADGLTVLLTTHYIEEADMLCDRVGLMNDGRLVECDTPEALVRTVGAVAVDHFHRDRTETTFYPDRASAAAAASAMEGTASIRRANLEDVFVQRTQRRVAAA